MTDTEQLDYEQLQHDIDLLIELWPGRDDDVSCPRSELLLAMGVLEFYLPKYLNEAILASAANAGYRVMDHLGVSKLEPLALYDVAYATGYSDEISSVALMWTLRLAYGDPGVRLEVLIVSLGQRELAVETMAAIFDLAVALRDKDIKFSAIPLPASDDPAWADGS